MKTIVGTVIASAFALLSMAAPAQAGSGHGRGDLWVSDGELDSSGSGVQVHIGYRCDEGQNAGVGLFLTQTGDHDDSPPIFGGAGSGQRACTGEPESVTLIIRPGSGRFNPGRADATVSLIISGPGTANKTEQLTENIRLGCW